MQYLRGGKGLRKVICLHRPLVFPSPTWKMEHNLSIFKQNYSSTTCLCFYQKLKKKSTKRSKNKKKRLKKKCRRTGSVGAMNEQKALVSQPYRSLI